MTKKFKVSHKVPFPVGRDSVVYYYAFEEDPGLEAGDQVELVTVVPDRVSIDEAETSRDLSFYDFGTSDVMSAMQRLLKGQGRDGVSQRQWQALKEQVWQLQDLADTCAELEKLDVDTARWWYRIDGSTGSVVLFKLDGEEKELTVGGEFDSDEDKNSFAKGLANLINLSQDIRHSLKARVLAQNLFYSVRKKAAGTDPTDVPTV